MDRCVGIASRREVLNRGGVRGGEGGKFHLIGGWRMTGSASKCNEVSGPLYCCVASRREVLIGEGFRGGEGPKFAIETRLADDGKRSEVYVRR